MALKSIFDIEIRGDAKFQQFAKVYQQYQAAVEKSPAAWKAATAEIKQTAEEIGAAADARKLLTDMEKKSAALQGQQRQAAEYTAKSWSSIARSTKDVASHIASATGQLLKWTALTSVFSGLLGAGGLFGIERLAGTVGGGRRSALGLGLSYGQQKAFNVNYSRLGDPGSFLGGVNEALNDASKRSSLYGAGLTENQIAGRDTGQVATALIPALKRLVDQTPDGQLAQVIKARGLEQFGDLQYFKRLKSTSGAEVNDVVNAIGRDSSGLALAEKTQKAWQDLDVQLTRAGQKIENVLVNGLTPLAKPLDKLSESFTKAVESLLASPKLKEWMVDLGKGVETFAGYIGSDKFQSDVRALVKGIEDLSEGVVRALRFLHLIPQADSPGAAAVSARQADAKKRLNALGMKDLGNAVTNMLPDWLLTPEERQRKATNGALLNMVRRLEGSGDKAISPAGAIGRYQIMPGTAKQYGFDPSKLMDPAYNEKVAKVVLADLARRFNGDTDKILIGYNAGPGRAMKYGGNPATLPAETQKYLARAHMMREYAPSIEAYVGAKANPQSVVASPSSQGNDSTRRFSDILERMNPVTPSAQRITIVNQTGGSAIPIVESASK